MILFDASASPDSWRFVLTWTESVFDGGYKPHGDFLWRGSVLIISLGDVLNKQGYSSK